MNIKQLLDKHEIKHGIENDQARIDEFVKDAQQLIDDTVDTVIETTKEIYLKNDLVSLLQSDNYVKVREELRVEQHKHYEEMKAKNG